VKQRPILFSGAMVRAILEGRKTQTRRVIRGPEKYSRIHECGFCCPHGVTGDRLWVREQFSGTYAWNAIPPSGWGWDNTEVPIWYWADGNPPDGDWTRPKPSIHMPRRYSRITLEITDVRVQRLQDISEDDARAEGVIVGDELQRAEDEATRRRGWIPAARWILSAREPFSELWDSINAERAPWNSNPWVWAISFKRIDA